MTAPLSDVVDDPDSGGGQGAATAELTRDEPAQETPIEPGPLAEVDKEQRGDWTREAVVYQIYPRSFADANGDGIGDLAGAIPRLAAIAELGVDAIWLSPFYPSPQADGGYDVADYRDVDPIFGTVDDFDELLRTAHELGLRVIIDLVPNHSSDAHPWFPAAVAGGPGSPERARYIFRDGKGATGDEPPNNWPSVFGGSAWTRTTDADGIPGQWYLHFFDSRQPDFNWENPQVRAEFLDVLKFWLDRGVDGFRVDVANSLIKAAGLPDTPDPAHDAGAMGAVTGADPADQLPVSDRKARAVSSPMFDQDGVHEIYRSWRALLNTYSPPRLLVAEAWVQPPARLARYVRPDEMHQAFNFDFLQTPWHAGRARQIITETKAANDAVGAPTTWVLSNHDVVRHASRLGLPGLLGRPSGIGPRDQQPDAVLGLARARALTLTMLALPGSAYLYQGEELGLPEHTMLPDHSREDPSFFRTRGVELGRDGCRVPLPWEADKPGLGFSPTGQTWLPQPESFAGLARDRQHGVPDSTLEMYRAALRLRREYEVADSSLTWLESANDDILAFRNGFLMVLSNMGSEPTELPEGGVVLASGDMPDAGMLPPNTTAWIV